jgi:hypothetical protein
MTGFIIGVVALTWLCCFTRPMIPLYLLIVFVIVLIFSGPWPFRF